MLVELTAKGATFVVASETSEQVAALEDQLRTSPSIVQDAFTLLEPGQDQTVVEQQAFAAGFSDGSPSTEEGCPPAAYTGSWDAASEQPSGYGVMTWDNGIVYSGFWRQGQYHGQGSKLYSKGGGYTGQWHLGQRQGLGVSFYNGKFGYDRWEGPFEADMPHGKGRMYTQEMTKRPPMQAEDIPVFEFKHGKPQDTD
jgi:hypothetical protein